MNLFKENNFSKIIIAVLLIINIITLSIMWIQSSKGPVPPPPVNNSARAVKLMKEQLNLTPEQTKKFREMRRKHFTEVNAIGDSILSLKKQIMDEIFIENQDTAKVNMLAQQIGKYQAEIEKLNFEHFLKFSLILDKGQKDKLHSVISRLPGNPRPGRPLPPPPPRKG